MLWTTLLIIGVFVLFAYLMIKSGGGCCGGHKHHGNHSERGDHTESGGNNKTSHGSCCGM